MWSFALQKQCVSNWILTNSFSWGRGAGNEGPASKKGYSTPSENKVPRKPSDVVIQRHPEVLEIWDLKANAQSPPLPVGMMLVWCFSEHLEHADYGWVVEDLATPVMSLKIHPADPILWSNRNNFHSIRLAIRKHDDKGEYLHRSFSRNSNLSHFQSHFDMAFSTQRPLRICHSGRLHSLPFQTDHFRYHLKEDICRYFLS